ncbi:MAG: dehydrogenase, partial [Caulobacteraceae bacterium]|nr:dehydrogenase [Caulobacteraceae bacterium]
MAQRIALWGGVLLFVVIAGLSLWQALPLLPLTESRYYFLTAALFIAAAGWTALRGLKDPGEGAVWGWAAGFAALLTAVGAYLAVKGAQLLGLGGSPYYLIVGLALVAVAVLLVLRSVWSARLYAAILAVTIVWSLIEAGLDLWALMA